jgi:nucleoside-diphosphate-sugar epimerase
MILVIGATSFIGPSVIKRLLKRNNSIKCLIRTGSSVDKILKRNEKFIEENNSDKKIYFSTGNLLSTDSLFDSLSGIDTIVYLIDLENTQLLENLLLAVSRTSIKRAVFISSTTVLVPQNSAVKEKKIYSEEQIKDSSLDWTILRPTMIYGTPDDKNFSKMLNFIKKRGFFVIFGNGQNLIQPVYIDDVSEAISLVLDNKKTYKKIYEISGKNSLKYFQMLKIIQSKVKRPFKIIRLPINLSRKIVSLYCRIFKKSSLRPDMIERMQFDKAYSYENAAKDFKYSPTSFEAGIRKLIDELGL